ncbi:MAG: Flp pilus assembly protein CpaB [Deltaproteobacteria bacterium]|nr:Flp pilus assembly protein CpaB [Deltaproteobacteria bacterium]
MDKKAVLIGMIAAVIGGICLFLYMQRFEKETSGGAKVAVLMATQDIRFGDILDKNMLGVRNLPQAYLEQRHIRSSDLESVLGTKMSMSVKANECVLWSDLATMQKERRDLSGMITTGMRALSIQTSTDSLLGGLLRPGDFVDIVFSPDSRVSGSSHSTLTLLQNILVMAVGSDTGGKKQGFSYSRNLTLSVTPKQAQLVIQAKTEGKLDVALRNPEDIVVLQNLPETQTADITETERRSKYARRSTPQDQGGSHEIERIQ